MLLDLPSRGDNCREGWDHLRVLVSRIPVNDGVVILNLWCVTSPAKTAAVHFCEKAQVREGRLLGEQRVAKMIESNSLR